jgi:peroxiredoxin-like protein
MADLHFEIEATWKGTGKEGGGVVRAGGHEIPVSGPTSMGGKGEGASPEELLLTGITSCYSGTLIGVLKRAGLPVDSVSVKTDGVVSGYPLSSKFGELTVNPTILGGDKEKLEEYKKNAEVARDKCFVGKTVVGNMVYNVGEVKVEA